MLRKIFKFLLNIGLVGSSTCSIAPLCAAETENLSVPEAVQVLKKNQDNPHFVLLDVRTAEEFKSGHIERALMVDFYAPDFKAQLSKMDKNKTYLIYCRSGNRSGKALKIMNELGFLKVSHIQHGVNSWVKENQPLVLGAS